MMGQQPLRNPAGDRGAVPVHSPAPWRWTDGTNEIDIAAYDSPGYYQNPELVAANGDFVVGCDEYWTIGPMGEDQTMIANARLIAAAPDMLAALIDLVDTFKGYQGIEMRAARATIAKATGSDLGSPVEAQTQSQEGVVP